MGQLYHGARRSKPHGAKTDLYERPPQRARGEDEAARRLLSCSSIRLRHFEQARSGLKVHEIEWFPELDADQFNACTWFKAQSVISIVGTTVRQHLRRRACYMKS